MACTQVFVRRLLMLSCGALCAAHLPPARAGDARYLKGAVVSATERGKPKPLPDATLHLRGAKDAPTTDDDGRFWLILPGEVKPGDTLFIDAEKEGYRIWQPLDGPSDRSGSSRRPRSRRCWSR